MDQLKNPFVREGEYVPTIPSAGVTKTDAAARVEAEAAQKRKDNTHWGDLMGATIVQSSPIGWADRALQAHGIQSDPNYWGEAVKADHDQWIKEGLGSQIELLEKARSKEHADLLKGFAHTNIMAAEDSAQFNPAARMLAGLADPSMFAIGALSGGLGYGANAGRLANAVRSGLVGAVTNVGSEALVGQYNPEVTSDSLVAAGVMGFVGGGAFGFRKGELADMAAGANKMMRSVNRAEAKATGNTADSMGAARVEGSGSNVLDGPEPATPEWIQQKIDDAQQNAHIRPAFTGQGEGSKFLPKWLTELSFRRDIAGRFGSSNDPLMRDIGRKLVRDSVGNTDRDVAVKFAAAEEAELLDHTIHGSYRRNVEAEWDKFSKENGVSGEVARQQFNESVGYHMRGVAQDMTPEVEATAKHAAAALKNMHDELRAAGVPGFEKEVDGRFYLPRVFSAKGYTDLNGTKGLSFDNLRDNLVKPAMRSEWAKNLAPGETIDEDLLHEVSNAWLKRGYDKAMGNQAEFHGSMKAADVDGVRQLLTESGVDKSKVEALVGKWERDLESKGVHARAKARIDLDESFKATLKNDLGESHEVNLADLLENNVDKLVPEYIREMSGWAALKKHLDVGTPRELEVLRDTALKRSKAAGDSDLTRIFDITTNSILGKSTSDAPNSAWTRGSRLIRSQNFLTTMGQVGFTMLESVGGTLGAAGLRNAVKAVPAALDMMKQMRLGKFNTEEARWLADITGLGTDFTRNQPYLRLDAVGESVWSNDKAVGRALNKLDRGMQYAQRYMSVVSGIAHMQQFNQGFAGIGIAGRLVELANKKTVPASMVRRLRAGGLDKVGQERLFTRLRGLKSVHDIAKVWDKWSADDKRLMALFVQRNAKRTLGEGGVGDTIQLMHSATGRLLTQFRTFQTNSHTAVLLHGLHMRDWQTAQMWTGSMLFAGIGMAARNYLNTMGMPPEEREKRMAIDSLAKQAFQQASFSSYIPFVIDTIAHDLHVKEALGGDDTPVFAYGRSTGLDSGVQGIPTLATARSLWNLGGVAANALNPDKQVTSKQIKDTMTLLWFQNVTGVRNGISWMAQQFPNEDH